MAFEIVTVARTLGAGGEALGEALSKALGCRYIDSEIITRAAKRTGVPETTVAKSEAHQSWISRVLENLSQVPLTGGTGEVLLVPPPAERYETVIVDVIREVAAQGNVVILAHGASYALANRQNVFRVLVTASEEARTTRLALSAGIVGSEARKQIVDSDKARHEFLQRFYKVDHERPTDYDLVVNTDHLSIAQAEAAILAAVRA